MYNMKFNFSIFGTNYSISLTFILLGIILWLILSGNLLCSCLHVMPYEGFEVMKGAAGAVSKKVVEKITNKKNKKKLHKEGFVGANLNNGDDMDSSQIDTSKWFGPNLQNNLQNFNNGPLDEIPTGMLLFKDTKFSPECCSTNPSFSNSSGCACLNKKMYLELIHRGGNNIPYSEY